jgi:hypothetical protein
MGFLSRFSSPNLKGTTAVDNSHRYSTSRRDSRSKSKVAPQEDGKSEKYRCAERFLQSLNEFDPQNPDAFVVNLSSNFTSNMSKVLLEDGKQFNVEMTDKLLRLVYESNPEFQVSYSQIVEGEENQIIVKGVCGTANTGVLRPFTTMSFSKNYEERYVIEMRGGKMHSIQIV